MSGLASDSSHSDHAHPSERQYWVIFGLLAAITGVEIAWSYLGIEGFWLVMPLLLMMVVKFILVGGVFMHLQSDAKKTHGRAFTLIFGTGIVLAVLVFFIVIAAFQFAI